MLNALSAQWFSVYLSLSKLIWNLVMLDFEEMGKLKYLEKNL